MSNLMTEREKLEIIAAFVVTVLWDLIVAFVPVILSGIKKAYQRLNHD